MAGETAAQRLHALCVGRAAAGAAAARTPDGEPPADRGADQAGEHDRPGGVHRTRRDDLNLVRPGRGPRALAQRLRKTVRDGCRLRGARRPSLSTRSWRALLRDWRRASVGDAVQCVQGKTWLD